MIRLAVPIERRQYARRVSVRARPAQGFRQAGPPRYGRNWFIQPRVRVCPAETRVAPYVPGRTAPTAVVARIPAFIAAHALA